MPTQPLLQSPRQQRQLVAVLMCAVFMASLGVAHLFSASRAYQTVQVGRLQFQVPGDWQRDTALEQRLGLEGAQVYRNPHRPQQVLRVLPVQTPQPEPAGDMLQRALPMLLSPMELQTFQLLPMQAPSSGGTLQAVDVAGISQVGPRREDVRVHLVAAMTRDGQGHWLLHLADQPGAEEQPAAVLQQNAFVFRQIERFAVIAPPEGASGRGRIAETPILGGVTGSNQASGEPVTGEGGK